MKTNILRITMFLLIFSSFSCEDFLEVDSPNSKITSSTVFENEETTLSALEGLYNQLAAVDFSSGSTSSVTILGALSADVLEPIYTSSLPYVEFDHHEILPSNFRNLQLWSSAYNVIYTTNILLEGMENSDELSQEVQDRVRGEAMFVRAFTYFYLVNLYDNVPLVLSSDYETNALAKRNSVDEIYQQIILDLGTAIDLLDENYSSGERLRVNRYAALSLLARVHLFLGNWEKAEIYSTQVINQDSTYKILEDLDKVFLANSSEAIWQLSPTKGGSGLTNTNEGAYLIIHPLYYFLGQFKLEQTFINSFSSSDLRFTHWVGLNQSTGYYFSHKYKVWNSTEDVSEYSTVLRLAEQYLIRAEARARQNDLATAISDVDVIRKRAGLTLIADTNPSIEKEALIDLIIEERKKELFTEWGHRWLDLNRTGIAEEVFGASIWESFDEFYPIPENEIMKNPNLTQNDGY